MHKNDKLQSSGVNQFNVILFKYDEQCLIAVETRLFGTQEYISCKLPRTDDIRNIGLN